VSSGRSTVAWIRTARPTVSLKGAFVFSVGTVRVI
jgi:hypothetical protein